jgi:hypothetical protein
MNNSYLVETDECLGYCSIVPEFGEVHMFDDKVVRFSHTKEDKLFFTLVKDHEADHEADLKQAEDRNDVCFGVMMDSLFVLAEELHERDELTESEETFLDAFDEYVETAVELNELEDENGGEN